MVYLNMRPSKACYLWRKKQKWKLLLSGLLWYMGQGVKGNFNSIMKWANMPLPLPFGAIHNRRSLVALDNLVSLVNLCVNREKSFKAANQVLLISDCNDISTTQLFEKVRQVLDYRFKFVSKTWLLPVPYVY